MTTHLATVLNRPRTSLRRSAGREPLAHAAYSPDLATSNCPLFASLGHALADQRFTSYENVKSWLDDWLTSKDRNFFLACDEAHFWLNGYVNKQNCRIWSEANPQVYVETPLHPEKLTAWCALWAGGIHLQKR
ncbi:hypothetical protein TNCV_4434591 [Trichonephila clavipes]|nr:hypothetical protein TNCV_4434591 [Trichonephila clavipes]